jgi:lipoprotein-anchoring transpeptidase ErfK/SrfK
VRAWPAFWVCCVVVLAGCGQQTSSSRSEGPSPPARVAGLGRTATTALVRRCVPRSRTVRNANVAYAAVVRSSLAVYRAPSATRAVRRFGPKDVNGYPVVFSVAATRTDHTCKAAWYRVRLPTVPNGSTGWVKASTVQLFRVRTRIVVELRARRLRAYRLGREVLDARVTIGAPQTPTPVGRFYVSERFLLASPSGPFGPSALGISAHSAVLQDWVQGGPIALHGTNRPDQIGQAASHGCVRLPNATMKRLFALAPAGTPVIIRP